MISPFDILLVVVLLIGLLIVKRLRRPKYTSGPGLYSVPKGVKALHIAVSAAEDDGYKFNYEANQP